LPGTIGETERSHRSQILSSMLNVRRSNDSEIISSLNQLILLEEMQIDQMSEVSNLMNLSIDKRSTNHLIKWQFIGQQEFWS
jgi:hypothetical protein